MIQIDKDIPIPSNNDEYREALSKMEVGDSFFLPNLTVSGRTTLYRIAKQFNAEFTTRAVDGGTRVWRRA